MTGNQDGETLVLTVKVQDMITVPARVYLHKEELRWETLFEATAGDMGTLEAKSVSECLKDFINLGDAPAETILSFARKYGPLGIVPMVEGEVADGGTWARGRYREPLALYRSLSQRARSIVRVMQCLRAGKPLTHEESNEMFPTRFREFLAEHSTGAIALWAYTKLTYATFSWQHSATTKYDISSHEEGPGVWKEGQYQINWPRPLINFGHWDDGNQWDQEKNCQIKDDDLIALVSGLSSSVVEGRLPVLRPEQIAYFQEAGEPYLKYWEDVIQQVPNTNQRPSPLFNALAFQLMQVITVKEGTFFCSVCGDMQDRHATNGRKPRTDRAEFCSTKCRDDERRRKDRLRKPPATAEKREAVDPK